MPRFVVVPSSAISVWGITSTTIVEGKLNGLDLVRRSLKPWDAQRWFIDLPEQFCRRAGIDTGDRVTLLLRIASDELPRELARLIADDPAVRKVWRSLTPSRQRMLREHILAAKRSETRQRRVRRALKG